MIIFRGRGADFGRPVKQGLCCLINLNWCVGKLDRVGVAQLGAERRDDCRLVLSLAQGFEQDTPRVAAGGVGQGWSDLTPFPFVGVDVNQFFPGIGTWFGSVSRSK